MLWPGRPLLQLKFPDHHNSLYRRCLSDVVCIHSMRKRTPPVEYRVRILPAQHELEVSVKLTGSVASGRVRLEIPTWVPGDYSFAQYGRDLFGVRAEATRTRHELKVTREGWQAFHVENGRGAVTVTYKASASATKYAETSGIVDSECAVLLG